MIIQLVTRERQRAARRERWKRHARWLALGDDVQELIMSDVRWMEQVDSHWLGYDAARQRWRPLLEFNHMDDYVEALLSGDYSRLCAGGVLARDRAELGPWPWQWFATRLIEHLDTLPVLPWYEARFREETAWWGRRRPTAMGAYLDTLSWFVVQYGEWPEGYDGWPRAESEIDSMLFGDMRDHPEYAALWRAHGDHPDYAALASAWLWD